MVAARPVKVAENRLARFTDERGDIVAAVEQRVGKARLAAAARGRDDSLEYVLNDVAFQEIKRLERGPASGDERKRVGQWRDLSRRLGRMSDAEKRQRL